MMRLPTRYILAGLLFWSMFNGRLYAAQEVVGIQSGVWRLDKSPYIVRNDICIPKGLALKIEEGVIIKFAGNYQMIVEGALIANGTKTKPIVFTSIFDADFGKSVSAEHRNPQPSDWKGIEFLDTCDDYSTVLNHCIIRFSQWGIRCTDCYPLLTDIRLVENKQSTLNINNNDYPFEPGRLISPIAQSSRARLAPLPEPVLETNLERAKRLMALQKQKIEQERLRALQDSLEKANKVKPIETQTGRIVLDRKIFDQLHVQSLNELISYLPGFYNIATIWTGDQLTSRGIPPALTNNRMLVLQDGIPFYEPLAKSSYLEFLSLEAIERIEVDRGVIVAPFDHQGIIGSVNWLPRREKTSQFNKLKMELGNFGTRRLTTFLGFTQAATAMNLSMDFMNNSGYWKSFSPAGIAPPFRQKYATDRFNFSLALQQASLKMLVNYFENDQFQLGLIPQLQYAKPLSRRGLTFSMSREIEISSRLSGTIIGNYIKIYERSEFCNLDSSGAERSAATKYLLSKGNLLSISILSKYKETHYTTTAGVTVSRCFAEPLFELKGRVGEFVPGTGEHNVTSIGQYESSALVGLGYNFSPFIGFDGKTSIHFVNLSDPPDVAFNARIIYNPFLPFDSYLKYSFVTRPATLIERYSYLPELLYGNADLKSERFEQWEWSTDLHLKTDLTMGLVLYRSKHNHIIQLTPEHYFVNNADGLRTTGCEALLQGKIIDRTYLLTNIAYNYVKFAGWTCPQWKISGLATIHWFQLFSTTAAIQYSSQIAKDIKLGPYYLVNLSLAYQLMPNMKISLHGNNLLNQRPENPEYFRGEITAIPASPGRSFYMTLAIE